MSSDIETFLTGVRDADDPSSEDERRVRKALRASIAAGVASSVAVKASALPSAAGQSALGAGLSAFGTKLGVVAVSGALVIGAGHVLLAARAPDPVNDEPPRAVTLHEPLQPRPPQPSEARPKAPELEPAEAAASEPVRDAGEATGSPPTVAEPQPTSRRGSPESLEAELTLLREVQSALRRGAGHEALRKLDAHHTRDRQFLAERSAARILALCAVGRVEEARQRGEAFLKEHPRSLQRAAILESCASPRRGPAP